MAHTNDRTYVPAMKRAQVIEALKEHAKGAGSPVERVHNGIAYECRWHSDHGPQCRPDLYTPWRVDDVTLGTYRLVDGPSGPRTFLASGADGPKTAAKKEPSGCHPPQPSTFVNCSFESVPPPLYDVKDHAGNAAQAPIVVLEQATQDKDKPRDGVPMTTWKVVATQVKGKRFDTFLGASRDVDGCIDIQAEYHPPQSRSMVSRLTFRPDELEGLARFARDLLAMCEEGTAQ